MNAALPIALQLAEQGYRIVPIPPGEKYPKGLPKWQEKATDDVDIITGWLEGTENGIGWVMGTQPNGDYLVAIDVDVADGKVGKTTLAALIREHGLSHDFQHTVTQRTGTGGIHFIFSTTEDTITNGTLGEHVDTRGEGGFIVCAPSIHPNGQPYTWSLSKAPWQISPYPLPAAISQMLTAEVSREAPTLKSAPAKFNDSDDPKDWLRSQFTCLDFIERLGWQQGPTAGTQTKYTRPGKSVKEGSSAVYHSDEDIFNIFTTTVPPEMERWGHHSRSGVLTLNAFDLWSIVNGMSTPAESMSVIRKTLMPPSTRTSSGSPLPGGESVDPSRPGAEGDSASLNLPDEFWESRPTLAHIRQAAWSRMEAPDAVLGTMLARYAACIPVSYNIPAIVGAPATFDHLSVLVGESSGGKSVAMSIARELFPGPQFKTIVWDLPVPTGEGLISSFFEEVTEEDGGGKKKLVSKKTKDAVHFSIDEGMALIQAGAQRQGTTIASVLCSAWTGQNPGQANASKERRRVDLKPFSFRVSGVMGIQFALGHHLLADNWVDQGLSGRLLFFSTEDTSIPFDSPPWPGPLELPVHPITPLELTYDAQIVSAVREAHHAKKTRQVHEAPIDGHQRLVRLKISGILALLDGRTSVSFEDWNLAGIVLTSSVAIRDAMKAVAAEATHQANVTKATAAGMYSAVSDDAAERKKVAQLRDRIPSKIPPEGIGIMKLAKRMTSGDTRHRFHEALTLAAHDGAVVVDNDRVFLP